MDAWMDGVLDGWRREEEMEGWMEARMQGWMGECVKEYAQPICMVYYLFPQAKGRLLLATTPPNPFVRHSFEESLIVRISPKNKEDGIGKRRWEEDGKKMET